MRPILFTIFGLPIHSYGVMLALGFALGAFITMKRASRFGLLPNKMFDCMIWSMFIGVIGARFFFVIQEWGYYRTHLNQLFQMSGLTSFGGIVVGTCALIGWSIKNKVSIWSVLDCVAPGFIAGHIIGRIGCLLNGCCFGRACSADFLLKVHGEGSTLWHQPAQLYDALINVGVFVALLRTEKQRRNDPLILGRTFAFMLIFHGASRFVYEFWRAGTDSEVASGIASSTYWVGWLTQAQAFALLLMAIGGVVLFAVSRRSQTISRMATA